MNSNQKLLIGWCITILLALFALFSIASCNKEEEPEYQDPQHIFVEDELSDRLVEEVYEPIFTRYEFLDYGYSSMGEWYTDMKNKQHDAMGVADSLIDMYTDVITDEQIAGLREHEKTMMNTWSVAEYNKASEAFDAIAYECDAALSAYLAPKYAYSGSYSGGGFDIPYNFYTMGVLHDNNYRYTYYSSNVLYHYRTPEWTLGSDGIYRDSAGRVVVASDDYPEGSVVQSELFGECIVLDCGVGSSGTLDVYVGW